MLPRHVEQAHVAAMQRSAVARIRRAPNSFAPSPKHERTRRNPGIVASRLTPAWATELPRLRFANRGYEFLVCNLVDFA